MPSLDVVGDLSLISIQPLPTLFRWSTAGEAPSIFARLNSPPLGRRRSSIKWETASASHGAPRSWTSNSTPSSWWVVVRCKKRRGEEDRGLTMKPRQTSTLSLSQYFVWRIRIFPWSQYPVLAVVCRTSISDFSVHERGVISSTFSRCSASPSPPTSAPSNSRLSRRTAGTASCR